MSKMRYQRPQSAVLTRRQAEPRRFVQVVAGPRQVGKCALAQEDEGATPRERLAFMMEDTGARAVVATRSVLDRLPPCEARTLVH